MHPMSFEKYLALGVMCIIGGYVTSLVGTLSLSVLLHTAKCETLALFFSRSPNIWIYIGMIFKYQISIYLDICVAL